MTLEEFLAYDQHKCYCEIVVGKDGTIWYAHPCHSCKLIDLSDKPRGVIDDMIPVNASPTHWLVEYTGIGAVWYDFFIMPIGITMEQAAVMKGLAEAGKVRRDSVGTLTNEKTLCDAIVNGGDIERVPTAVSGISVYRLEDYVLGRYP